MTVIRVDSDADGERLDTALGILFPERSRSFFRKLIDRKQVLLNGKEAKASRTVSEGDTLSVEFPEAEPLNILPEPIPLEIVYEDADVILVNKPQGMVVHPAAGHYTGTLLNGLLYHCKDLSGINGVLRPGIVHRIDKDTSGIVIACKNDAAHRCIAEQLAAHTVSRRYYALVHGGFREDGGTVDAPLGRHKTDRKKMAVVPDGKRAVTHFRVLERFERFTLVECRLETGRTHQIRVHMAHIGHPLAGDPVYGSGKAPFHTEGQMLHAYLLGFRAPSDGRYLEFTSDLPAHFREALEKLRKRAPVSPL